MHNYHDLSSIVEMSEPIINWESIVHKNVRSKDGVDVVNVAEVDEQLVKLAICLQQLGRLMI